jgi:acyl carrier protein
MTKISIEAVLDLVNTILENTRLTVKQADDDLTRYGMDSISFIRMIVTIEELFEVEVPDEYMLFNEMNTVNKICKLLNFLKRTNKPIEL